MENKLEKVTDNSLNSYLTSMGLAAKLNEKEKNQFLEISKAYNLNPFKREIYCVKYGDTLSIIVGYESYIKRAERSGLLDGWSIKTEGVGNDLKAIVTINRKDWRLPFVHETYFREYVQNNRFWKEKPITMIKKVAIAQAFRMAFSSEIGGMPYTSEEIVENETAYAEIIEIKDCSVIIEQVNSCTTLDELMQVWKENKAYQKEIDFINAKNNKKTELENGTSNQSI